MKVRTLLYWVPVLLASAVWVFGQGVGTSAYINGTIRDSAGAVMPNVAVAIVDTQRGSRRTATSDAAGQYHVEGLSPANYDVSVAMPGFESQVQKGIALDLGQTVIVDFRLKISAENEVVEVTSERPVVDTSRAAQAGVIGERSIQDLPIDRRDYLTFSLLMPGISNANTIAGNADFRVKQTPQSGLSLYGSNGRGNNVTVDGGEANDDTGGVRLNVSQGAVQEFEIRRSNYSAELGSASGASVNIVTKSGTNDLHGSLYGFFRNDAMDARDPFAFSPALQPGEFSLSATGTPVKNSLNRQQFGGTLSLPIIKDKTFLFMDYEGLRSDAQDSVPLLTNSGIFAPTASQLQIISALANDTGNPVVPCISNFPAGPPVLLPAATCAFGLQSILTVDPAASGNPFVSPGKLALNQFIVNQFEKDGGLFPFTTRQHAVSGRLDHRSNNNNQGFLRYSFAHLSESDPDVHALTAFSRGTSVHSWDSTLQGSWFHQFSAATVNEARLQWNLYQFNVDTNDSGGPGLDVQGYGFFGRSIFLPSHTTGRRYEFTDNLALNRGRHTMRMGLYELVRGNNTTSDTFFAGRFEFLDLPGIVLSNCLQLPSVPIAQGGCGLAPISPASISTLQSWSLGAPAFYEQGFGDPRYVETRPFTAAYWQDSWQVRRGFTLNYGLRYELDAQNGILNTYKENFAPRLSFAWDPANDHKTVVRGGYGIFYAPIYFQIPGVVKSLGNVNGVRRIANSLVTIQGGAPANSAEIFGAMFAQGKILCGQPPNGANSCITESDLSHFVTVSNTGPLPPGTVLFSAQRDYRNPQAQQASLGIERQIGSGASISANYIYVHTTHLPWAIDRNLLPGAPVVSGVPGANGLRTNGFPFQDWGASACVTNPGQCFGDPTRTILQNNEYDSVAGSVYHGAILELTKRFSAGFSVLANYTFSKAIDDSTDFNSDYAPFNQVDLRAERALSDFDQRHKIVVAANLESPWRSRVLSGFQLAPIVSYNSGHPFNLLAGADINGDNHFTNDRPPGAPRNSGLGPNFTQFDMRLSRRFKLGERAHLQFTAEGFNIANRTNYATVNNIVGSDFTSPFAVPGTSAVSPSQKLGYTAALPKREIQLGVRIDF